MSKSKKTSAKKKPAPKKKRRSKPAPVPFRFWFEFGFPKPGLTYPKLTKPQVEQYYRDYLANWDAANPGGGGPHQIKFTWELSSSHPNVHTLTADIYPGPVALPHPPPEGGSISPPTPPPPPPPSLS